MEEYIGVIKLFALNYEPQGWMICDGRTLNTSQFQALYSVIGTTYTGSGAAQGNVTFNLPDLRACIPVGMGTPREIGQKGALSNHGTPTVGTLGLNYMICVEGLYPSRQ